MFNPNSSVIYPGNMLQGKTLDDATPEAIPLKRAGGTISYNIIDGNLNSSSEVDEVKLSAIRDAQNDIIFGSLADNDYKVPANFSLSVEQVQSKEELALKLGVKYKTFNAKVSGSFSVNTSREVNTVLVKLTQQFYTMDFDLPTSPDDFFDESVTPEDLQAYIQPDNPAAFISSVTYGRIFYMLFESTSSATEMEAKLNVGYKTIGASGEGNVEFDSFSSLKNLTLQVIAYGGDSSETLDAVGNFTNNNSIGEFLSKIGKSSDIRTGLPLSYIANSVERRSQIIGAKLATEYDVVNCELRGVLPPVLYSDLLDLFDDGIGAMVNISASNNVLIFNKAGDKYAWYNGNLPGVYKNGTNPIIFDINDPSAPLGDMEINEVGAGVDFSLNVLYLFNGNGTQCHIMTVDPAKIPSNAPPAQQIVTYSKPSLGSASTIFLVNEIFGDLGEFKLSNGIGAAVSTAYPTMAYFERDGTHYQRYRSSDPNIGWNSILFPSNGWFSSTAEISPGLFNKVGAATKFNIGGGTTLYLFANETGDEIVQWRSVQGSGDTFQGPWIIN